MSPPVGPALPPGGHPPPPVHLLTHAASAAQVATSRATPEIPPPLGGGGHVGRGEPRGPGGEGHRGYRSHARRATLDRGARLLRSWRVKWDFGFGGRLVLKTERARRRAGAEGTGYEAGCLTMIWDGQVWGMKRSARGAVGFECRRSRPDWPVLSSPEGHSEWGGQALGEVK